MGILIWVVGEILIGVLTSAYIPKRVASLLFAFVMGGMYGMLLHCENII